jgi:hypothetical protein
MANREVSGNDYYLSFDVIEELLTAMRNHVLANTQLIGKYKR